MCGCSTMVRLKLFLFLFFYFEMRRTIDSSRVREEILDYYRKNIAAWKEFDRFIKDRSNISLRLLEYTVLKYSRKEEIHWLLAITQQRFYLYNSYREQLRKYRKRNFDPFGRHGKDTFTLHGIDVCTTVGQMNFFRWAYEYSVFRFMKENRARLLDHMKEFNRVERNKKSKKGARPRNNVSVKSSDLVTMFDTFDPTRSKPNI
jgi:hypothetical protein